VQNCTFSFGTRTEAVNEECGDNSPLLQRETADIALTLAVIEMPKLPFPRGERGPPAANEPQSAV